MTSGRFFILLARILYRQIDISGYCIYLNESEFHLQVNIYIQNKQEKSK